MRAISQDLASYKVQNLARGHTFTMYRRVLCRVHFSCGGVHILRRHNFWCFLTPPSLSVDNLFNEAYVLVQTFGKPLPPSPLSTQNVKAPLPRASPARLFLSTQICNGGIASANVFRQIGQLAIVIVLPLEFVALLDIMVMVRHENFCGQCNGFNFLYNSFYRTKYIRSS